MHSKGVIHRDLKPENILLDDKMRIKITDFGTAKLLDYATNENGEKLDSYPEDIRANSFVGTAEYVSPELLTDKATGKGSDIWAFGCIIYQLIAGRPPFKAANEYQTFQKIVKLQYSYPPGFPYAVRDLVKRVLVLNPHERLGIARIKAHMFFEGVDWDRKAIWRKPHPRLIPYRAASKTSATVTAASKLATPFRPIVSRHHQQQQQQQPSNVAATNAKNAITSASAAAAALAKKPSAISSYRSPTQAPSQKAQGQYQPPQSSNSHTQSHQPSSSTSANPLPSSSVHVSRSSPAVLTLNTSAAAQPSRVSYKHTSASASQLANSPVTPTNTAPSHKYYTPKETNNSPSSPLNAYTTSTKKPSAVRLELPPLTQMDVDWASILQHHEERILNSGQVTIITTSSTTSQGYDDDSDKEPSRITKMFTGARRKKRTLLVTTLGRLLIIGSDDRKIVFDIPIAAPQVSVREYAYNKKSNTGSFSVETHNKVFTIEDPLGSSDWIASISRARDYVIQASSEASSQALTAAAAAAAAASGITKYRKVSSDYTSETVNSSTSTFLQKNEERKQMRRSGRLA